MKKILAFACLTLLSACSSVDSLKPFDQQQAKILLKQNYVKKPASQMIAIHLPNQRDWKKIDSTLLIPRDESEANWTERIQTHIASFEEGSVINANIFAKNTLEEAAQSCKQLSRNTSFTHQYSIYGYRATNCNDHHDRFLIGKAFNGDEAVYVVTYTALSNQVSATEMNNMSTAIKSSRLIKARG